jgi:hypothetical protein
LPLKVENINKTPYCYLSFSFFVTIEAPTTKSYMGMLASDKAKLAQVNDAAKADPLFSRTMK